MPVRIDSLAVRQCALLGLGVALCSALTALAAPGEVPARPRAPLRIDKSLPESSPYRLEIQRSDYRMASAEAVGGRKKPRSGGEFSGEIERQARAQKLDPDLVHAVIRAESAYRPAAVSPKGAIGLMQVMPGTGKRFGVSNLERPESNLKAGTAYLRYLIDRFNNIPLALAGYNAGEGAVIKHGYQIPPYPETQGYVRSILRDYGDALAPLESRPRVYAEGIQLAHDLDEYRLAASAIK